MNFLNLNNYRKCKIRWLKVHYIYIAAYPKLTLSVSLGRLRGGDERWRKVQWISLRLGQLQDLGHTHTQAGK